MVDACRRPERGDRKREWDRIISEVKDATQDFGGLGFLGNYFLSKEERGEQIAAILLRMLVPALVKVQDAAERRSQIQSNLQVAVALAAYRADLGRFPESLDALSPKYLEKIPGDLFSGKPLIYRVTEDGYLLYSVGVNEIDEEGRWTDDEPRGDDPRIRIPVREPRASGR